MKYNQQFMEKLGFHSYRLTDPTNEFFKTPIVYLVMFILSAFSISSTITFAYKNFSRFDAALEAIFIFIAGVHGLGMYLSVGLEMTKVKALHNKLQEIVDAGTVDFLFKYIPILHSFCNEFLHTFSEKAKELGK